MHYSLFLYSTPVDYLLYDIVAVKYEQWVLCVCGGFGTDSWGGVVYHWFDNDSQVFQNNIAFHQQPSGSQKT